MLQAGVLALQGAIEEHFDALNRVGWQGVPIKKTADLNDVSALIIPGGESTAISRLMVESGLHNQIKKFAKSKPVMGTCAGMILVSSAIVESQSCNAATKAHNGMEQAPYLHGVLPLQLLDSIVHRNGFGRQVDSFEVKLDIEGIGRDVPAVFIRAPYIEQLGPGARALAYFEEHIVMAEQGNILGCAFHPELTEDDRILRYFLRKVKK